MEWNRVIYADCMNEENGLPTLEDKSVDLCLTDPPWNIKYKGLSKRTNNIKKKKVLYKDNYPDEWNLIWFSELERICKGIIVATTRNKLNWWYKNTDVRDMLILYFKNGTGASKISKWNCWSPYLFFGDFFRTNKLFHNLIETYIPWGFLSNRSYIHPSPKEVKIWDKIIRELKPESVIDPFLGSGTTAEVCVKLGIPWFGYEINEVYSQDINKRLKNCKKEPKQIELKLT